MADLIVTNGIVYQDNSESDSLVSVSGFAFQISAAAAATRRIFVIT